MATLPEAGATKRKETLGWPGPTAAAPARAPRRRAARRVARARTPQRGAMSALGAQNGVRVAAAQGRAQGAAGARRVCRVRQPAAGARARCGTPHVCAQAHARPAGRASGPSTTVLPSAARSARRCCNSTRLPPNPRRLARCCVLAPEAKGAGRRRAASVRLARRSRAVPVSVVRSPVAGRERGGHDGVGSLLVCPQAWMGGARRGCCSWACRGPPARRKPSLLPLSRLSALFVSAADVACVFPCSLSALRSAVPPVPDRGPARAHG